MLAAMAFEPGKRLGQYEVLSALGAGGMGEVYQARDTRLGRDVAIKILPRELASDPTRLARFEREARTLASLNHPHIVTIHSVEDVDGIHFFTMELIEGVTLEKKLAAGPLPAGEMVSLFDDIVAALAAAHAGGVTHRDLKPANIMVSHAGWLTVLDFGLATSVAPVSGDAASDISTLEVSLGGKVFGTLPYMSPEQLMGRPPSPASDLFSLGAVLYEMATGERLFRGASSAEVISSILRDDPPFAADLGVDLPRGFGAVLERCLARRPEARFASGLELQATLRELEHAVQDDRPTALEALAEPAHRFRTPLAGRQREAAELRRGLEQARSGHGRLILVRGEAGVGKTRLCSELVREARSRGCLALAGGCYESEARHPFGPWLEILGSVARIVPEQALSEHLGEGAPEIAALSSALRHLFPELPPPVELPPEARRGYLFDCVGAFIERASDVQPLLFYLDDLHWADESTLLLLLDLSRKLASLPVLIVASYRDTDLGLGSPLTRVVETLEKERLVERMAIERLTEQSVGEILGTLGKVPAPEATTEAFYELTGGLPFFVEVLFDHLLEENLLIDADGGWCSGAEPRAVFVPDSVPWLVGRRLQRLSRECLNVLTGAAVLGRRFHAGVLAEMLSLGLDELRLALQEAARLGVIEEELAKRSDSMRFRFSHELVRETLLQVLTLPSRQELHLLAANAIDVVTGGEHDTHLPSLAYHYHQAGAAADVARAARALSLAGERALAIAAYTEAVEELERAQSYTADSDGQSASLLARLGTARRGLGRWDEAIEDWAMALPLYRAGDAEAAETCLQLSSLLIERGRVDEAGRWLDAALQMQAEIDNGARARLVDSLALTRSLAGRVEEASRLLSESDDAELSPDDELHRLLCRAHCHSHVGAASAQADAASKACELGLRQRRLWSAAEAASLFESACVRLGRFDRLDELEPSAGTLAQRVGHGAARLRLLASEAVRSWMTAADISEHEAVARDLIKTAGQADASKSVVGEPWLVLTTLWRGRFVEARQRAEQTAGKNLEAASAAHAAALMFLCDCHLGRREQALAVLEQWRSLLPSADGLSTVGAWELLLAAVEGLCILGQRSQAAELYPAVQHSLEGGAVVSLDGRRLLETVAGMAAAAGGDWRSAESHYESALGQAQQIPFRSEQAEARRCYAQMLLDRDRSGDRERARTLLAEAVDLYTQIGMPRHVEMARALEIG